MSKDPVWCLVEVKPTDADKVGCFFENFLKQSVLESVQNFPEELAASQANYLWEEKHLNEHPAPVVRLLNSYGLSEDWMFEPFGYELFFPPGLDALFADLEAEGVWNADSILVFPSNNRVAPTQMIYAGLGLEKAEKLPGYFGNFFVPPEKVKATLQTVRDLLADTDLDEAATKAYNIGLCDDSLEDVRQLFLLLPLALEYVLESKSGLLGLSYFCIGSLPMQSFDELKPNRLGIESNALIY